ncbi:SLBB domain-containing protein [Fibrobacterota bacterium]
MTGFLITGVSQILLKLTWKKTVFIPPGFLLSFHFLLSWLFLLPVMAVSEPEQTMDFVTLGARGPHAERIYKTHLFSPLDEETYYVGPGDVFSIVIDQMILEKQINPEGMVTIEEIGIVSMKRLTLKESKAKICSTITSELKSSHCQATLLQPKVLTVYVSGMVRVPGFIDIEKGFRLKDVLDRAGGFAENADNRYVKIITQKNRDTVICDLLNFYKIGDLKNNPYIRPESHIHVDPMRNDDPKVTVKMETYNKLISLHSDEFLDDVLLRANNYKLDYPWEKIKVFHNGEVYSVKRGELLKKDVMPNSVIEFVLSKADVYVGGEVAQPGKYPYSPGTKVIDYFMLAGITNETGSITRVQYRDSKGDFVTIDPFMVYAEPGNYYYIEESNVETWKTFMSITIPLINMLVVTATLVITLTR